MKALEYIFVAGMFLILATIAGVIGYNATHIAPPKLTIQVPGPPVVQVRDAMAGWIGVPGVAMFAPDVKVSCLAFDYRARAVHPNPTTQCIQDAIARQHKE